MISLEWAYAKGDRKTGKRILVDRLWPRGVTKDSLKIDLWLRRIAPSDELRTWFSHDPEKWPEFKNRYFSELKSNASVQELLDACKQQDVIFVFSAKEQRYNNAVALKEFVESKIA